MRQAKPRAAEDTRQKILTAAKQVFREDGGLDAGLRLIASRAGYTTGAIYNMFAGKEEIYAALLEDSLHELFSVVASGVATKADPEEALREAAERFVLYYQDKSFEYRLGLYLFNKGEEKGLGSENDERLNALLAQSVEVIEACFARISAAASSKADAKDLALALVAALMGILAMYYAKRDKSLDTNWRKLLDTTVGAFLRSAKS